MSGSSTNSSTRERISSIFSKLAISIISGMLMLLAPLASRNWCIILPIRSVQPSLTRSSSCGMPEMSALKFSILAFCQPASRLSAHVGSVGVLPRTSTVEGVRWMT